MSDTTSKDYFYAVGKDRKGPVPFEKLKELAINGELDRRDKIWCKGMESWMPAGEHNDLFSDLPPDLEADDTAEPPPLEDVVAEEVDWDPVAPDTPKSKFMERERLIVIVALPASVCITLIGFLAAKTQVSFQMFMGVGGILYVGGIVQYLIIHHRCWSLIPPKIASTTPGKAVGFLFIPAFSFYWGFVSFHNLATDANRTLEALKIQSVRVNSGVAIALAITLILNWLPEIGGFAAIAFVVLLIVFLENLAPAMEALEKHAPQTLQSKPPLNR